MLGMSGRVHRCETDGEWHALAAGLAPEAATQRRPAAPVRPGDVLEMGTFHHCPRRCLPWFDCVGLRLDE